MKRSLMFFLCVFLANISFSEIRKGCIASFSIPHSTNIEKISARSYIQDGLIMQFDGVENIGYDMHDSSSQVWIDLIGGLVAQNVDVAIWNNDSIEMNGLNFFRMNALDLMKIDALTNDNYSIEACIKGYNSPTINNQGIIGFGNSSARFLWLFFGEQPGSSKCTFNCQLRSNTNIRIWNTTGSLLDAFTSSVVVEDGFANGWFNANKLSYTTNVKVGSITLISSSNCFIGKIYSYSSFRGKIYSIRIYDRALSANEIQYNYKIDKERFNLP